MHLLTIIQNVNIEDKLKNAPDSQYEIGVFIGTMLPFVLLVIIAYAIYRYNRNKINKL
jgi:hypothetical protein